MFVGQSIKILVIILVDDKNSFIMKSFRGNPLMRDWVNKHHVVIEYALRLSSGTIFYVFPGDKWISVERDSDFLYPSGVKV